MITLAWSLLKSLLLLNIPVCLPYHGLNLISHLTSKLDAQQSVFFSLNLFCSNTTWPFVDDEISAFDEIILTEWSGVWNEPISRFHSSAKRPHIHIAERWVHIPEITLAGFSHIYVKISWHHPAGDHVESNNILVADLIWQLSQRRQQRIFSLHEGAGHGAEVLSSASFRGPTLCSFM